MLCQRGYYIVFSCFAVQALILELPSYTRLEQEIDPPVSPEAILAARQSVLRDLRASRLQAFMDTYQNLTIPRVEGEDEESIESPRDISQWGRCEEAIRFPSSYGTRARGEELISRPFDCVVPLKC